MSTELVRRQDVLPDAETWKTMLAMAETLVQSGLLPTAIKTPAAALAVIQKGRELSIPPMYALSNISIIGGKPVVGAEVMLAMIYRDHGDGAIQFEETTAERCSVVYRRRGWAAARRFEWTIEDAKQAGLLQKGGTWNQYRPAMLRHRCISAVARVGFPDSIGGMYTPEEMGAEVEVNDQGEVVVVQQSAPVVTIVPRTDDVLQPEPTTTEEERARAMVGDAPAAETAASKLRAHAIRRSKQLAEHAKTIGHADAEKIAAATPETMNPKTLRAWVERLESAFPDVADPDETVVDPESVAF